MKVFVKFLFLLIIPFCLITSCSSIYMPNVPATPMFRNSGEVYVAAHINPKGNVSGNLAMAISDNLAILANGSTIDKGALSNDKFNQWLAEGAIGYYSQIGQNKLQVLEIYAGYGIGKSEEIEQRASVVGYLPVETRLVNFDKVFAQVNYSSTKKDKIRLFNKDRELSYGTAIRLSRVGMKKFLINDSKQINEQNFFIEPVFFTRLQLSKGLDLQYSTGFNVGTFKNEYLKAGNAVFTLGVTYSFRRR